MPETGKIYQAIPKMLAETSAIGKDRKNQQQGWMFRGIDDVYNVVHPLLAAHGVFPVATIIDENYEERSTKGGSAMYYARLKIRYTFFADDGSSVPTEAVGEGLDMGDKATNKAMSIAYKYALFQLLCIPTMALDPDATTMPEANLALPPTATKPPILDVIIGSINKATKPDTLRKIGDRLDELTADEINEADRKKAKTLLAARAIELAEPETMEPTEPVEI